MVPKPCECCHGKRLSKAALSVYIDGKRVNETFNISKLQSLTKDYIELKLEIKDSSEHIGGINIFGKKFGNYSQGILLDITHE